MLFRCKMLRLSAAIFCLSASMLLPDFAFCRPLTPQEALNRCFDDDGRNKAAGSREKDYEPEAVIRNDYGLECVYVFNNTAAPGFMIVSADDCARPLLAYSDDSILDSDNLPPALKAWLDSYADEIGRYVSSGVAERFVQGSRSQLPSISPIIKSQWNQDSPYNDKCPIYSGSERCFTGCVATAAAQIMYMYKYPSKGVGSFSYTDEIKGQNRTLSANFGNTTYDWGSMTAKYTNSSSAKSKAAVATLMSHLGVAFKMDYDYLNINQSGATLYNAAIGLIDYFSYSKGIRYLASNYFSTDEWKRIVHDELSNGRPLLYEGKSDKSGHAFVCDGYNQSTDKFHFNWGWGGNGDGYYSLSALEPQVSGGAGGGNYNYTDSQAALFGIAKPSGNNDYMAVIKTYGDLTVSPALTDLSRSVTMGLTDSEYPAFYNYVVSDDTQAFQFGLRLKSAADGSEYIIGSNGTVELEPLHGTYTVSVSMEGENIPVGTYTATPIARVANESESGSWNTVYIEDGREDCFTMKVGKHYVKAYNTKTTECVPEVSDISCPEEVNTGRQFTVRATVEAKYADYQGEIIVKTMTPTNDTEVIGIGDYVTVPEGGKRTIEIPCKALRLSGESLDLCVADNNHRVFYDASEIRIIMGEPEFSVENASLPEDLSIRKEYVVSGYLKVLNAPYTGTVECKAFDDSGAEISTSESVVEVTLSAAGRREWLSFNMPAIEDVGTYHFAIFEAGGKKIADIPGETSVYCPQFKIDNTNYPAVVKQNDTYNFDFDITNIGERAYNGYINYVMESADGSIKYCNWTNYEVLTIAPNEKQSIKSSIRTYNVACGKYNISFFVTEDSFATEGIDTGHSYPLEIVSELGGITDTTGENTLIEARPAAADGTFELYGACTGDRITIYNTAGSVIYNRKATSDNPIIDIHPASSGLYIVKCRDCAIKIIVR